MAAEKEEHKRLLVIVQERNTVLFKGLIISVSENFFFLLSKKKIRDRVITFIKNGGLNPFMGENSLPKHLTP
jgi:hypothetical protein